MLFPGAQPKFLLRTNDIDSSEVIDLRGEGRSAEDGAGPAPAMPAEPCAEREVKVSGLRLGFLKKGRPEMKGLSR